MHVPAGVRSLWCAVGAVAVLAMGCGGGGGPPPPPPPPPPHPHPPHNATRHDVRIRAFCLTHDEPIPRASLDLFLDLLRSAHGPKLLRLKGLVALAEDPERPVAIHGVQHVLHVPAVLPRWPD